MSQEVTILHISDVHIDQNSDDDSIYSSFNDVVVALTKLPEFVNVDGVVVTGDIFYKDVHDCKNDEKEEVIIKAVKAFYDFINDINKIEYLRTKLTVSDFLFVPGNHDVSRNVEVGKSKNTDVGDYSLYRDFLKKFYGSCGTDSYNLEKLFTYRVFKENKIALIGLNSNCVCIDTNSSKNEKCPKCGAGIKIEKCPKCDNDIKIEKCSKCGAYIKIEKCPKCDTDIKNDEKPCGFAQISVRDINEVLDKVKDEYTAGTDRTFNNNEWTIVACFHHHFYIFPEGDNSAADTSIVRNSNQVIERLLVNNIGLALHGHKHTSVTKPLADKTYYEKEKSTNILNVFAAGSIKYGIGERAFHLIDLYPQETGKLADIKKLSVADNTGYDTEGVKKYELPPKHKRLNCKTQNIVDIIGNINYSEYERYTESIPCDSISRNLKSDKIIQFVSDVFTYQNNNLRDFTIKDYYAETIVYTIHYRALQQYKEYEDKQIIKGEDSNLNEYLDNVSTLLMKLKVGESKIDIIKEILDLKYCCRELQDKYTKVIEGIPATQQRLIAYICISVYLVDLYLAITKYAIKNEPTLNINFRLNEGLNFADMVPNNEVVFTVQQDRRAIQVYNGLIKLDS